MKLIPSTRGGMLLRFGLAALLVIALAAATTAVAGLLQFKQLASELGVNAALNVQVTIPNPGDAQTLLLIGSDHRAGESYRYANTDTMLLMRIDPNSTTINVLSIPRDLEVRLPNGGVGKLNSAYSVGGGANGLLRTLKSQVFPGLHVNHVIDVNFRGFSDLIDAIGCVYTDVDHRYFNVSAPGANNYSSIDIQPGYQKLCGNNQAPSGALAFVRFRHTDSDIVRNARQQAFLRWARQNYSGSQLFSNRDRLLRIFGRNAQTDYTLHSADALQNLITLVAFSAGHQLKSIPFPAEFSACGGVVSIHGVAAQTPCYVTAQKSLEERVFHELMTPTTASANKPQPSPAAAAGGGGGGHARGRHTGGGFGAHGAVADPADAAAQAAALARAGFPVYAPTLLANVAPNNSAYCSSVTGNCNNPAELATAYLHSYPRRYVIHAAAHSYPAYRITAVINSALGYYYGIQGTTWRNPPILAHPTQEQVVNGKTLLEYFNGGKLSLVAWRTPKAAYWVSNTLSDVIPNKQLIAIAASLKLHR